MKFKIALLTVTYMILTGQFILHAQVPLWKTIPIPPPMPLADTSGFVNITGNARMYFAVFNQKGSKPVLLIHGGFGSSDDWGFEVPLLEKDHQVIVMDCRGRGRSTMDDQPLSYELMTSDILDLMDTLKLNKVAVVGWSDGGIIGLLLAIHHPERISKLFAFGANYSRSGYADEPPDTALATRYMAQVKATYQKISLTPDNFTKMLEAVRKMYSKEPEISPAALRTINVPTVIADGEYEQFITREHTEKLTHLIPHARLVIIPNVSHGGPIQDPVRFHKAVTALLDLTQ